MDSIPTWTPPDQSRMACTETEEIWTNLDGSGQIWTDLDTIRSNSHPSTAKQGQPPRISPARTETRPSRPIEPSPPP